MNIATFRFQCRRCERRFNGASTSEANAEMITVAVVGGHPLPDTIGLATAPTMTTTHYCKDGDLGGMGIADFIGYEVRTEGETNQ